MKATLTFRLPEEAEEHRAALDGHRWQGVVADLDNRLRSMSKYHEGQESERASWARALLAEVISEHGVELH